jgi:hypothetical protein
VEALNGKSLLELGDQLGKIYIYLVLGNIYFSLFLISIDNGLQEI